MATIKDIHSRELGPYNIKSWLSKLVGKREQDILNCRTCCHFPHKLNRELDDYINDDCITYISKEYGQFTVNIKTRRIIN